MFPREDLQPGGGKRFHESPGCPDHLVPQIPGFAVARKTQPRCTAPEHFPGRHLEFGQIHAGWNHRYFGPGDSAFGQRCFGRFREDNDSVGFSEKDSFPTLDQAIKPSAGAPKACGDSFLRPKTPHVKEEGPSSRDPADQGHQGRRVAAGMEKADPAQQIGPRQGHPDTQNVEALGQNRRAAVVPEGEPCHALSPQPFSGDNKRRPRGHLGFFKGDQLTGKLPRQRLKVGKNLGLAHRLQDPVMTDEESCRPRFETGAVSGIFGFLFRQIYGTG